MKERQEEREEHLSLPFVADMHRKEGKGENEKRKREISILNREGKYKNEKGPE